MLKPNAFAYVALAVALFLGFMVGGDGPIFLAGLTMPFSVAISLVLDRAQQYFSLSYAAYNLLGSVAFTLVLIIEAQVVGVIYRRLPKGPA